MSATSLDKRTDTRWLTYFKALIFVLPSVVTWRFTCVWIIPKLREIFEAADLDLRTYGWLWHAPSILISLSDHGLLICVVLLVIVALLEVYSRRWRQYRRITASILVWAVNVAVLVGLANLLVLATVAAPSLVQAQ